jgi:hypothetical protein
MNCPRPSAPARGPLPVVAALIAGILPALLVGCERHAAPPADVACTNSLLAAACGDLAPELTVECLAGPGQCPGHFDVAPGQVARLARTRLLLRLPFQQILADKLEPARRRGLRIVSVEPTGGLARPDTYADICRAVADELVAAGLITRPQADGRLAEIRARLTKLEGELRGEVRRAGLVGRPVVAASHQEAYCRWLGLDVVAGFTGADIPAELGQAVSAARGRGAVAVIGNVPQGPGGPNRLASALGVPAVLFDNFPSYTGRGPAFDGTCKANVRRLIEAVAPGTGSGGTAPGSAAGS